MNLEKIIEFAKNSWKSLGKKVESFLLDMGVKDNIKLILFKKLLENNYKDILIC